MPEIGRFFFMRHLRATPNEFILHYNRGRLDRQGAGISYWFYPLNAAISKVPVEDCETTFVLNERTADFQEVVVQCTLRYRITAPQVAACRVNFTISMSSGAWVEKPLEPLNDFWVQRAQNPARRYLIDVLLVDALCKGAEVIRRAIEEALRADEEVKAMGLTLVSVQVARIAPSAELEKAIQTPAREGLQQKADEAVFQRRALAVEKERAIKENELATEIELARKQEQLIRQHGANALLQVNQQAESEKAKVQAETARQEIQAKAHARDTETKAHGEANARRLLTAAEAEAEAKRVELWGQAPSKVILGMVLQHLASHVNNIQHLNISPDLLGEALKQFLRERADQ
ncbi:MAG: band 7 protein [Planctomycetes bacterium]|nr:band 7 protein [Planctomycetota bacterium]